VCGDTTSYCLTFVDGATICGHTPNDHPAGLGFMHWPQGRPVDWREHLARIPPPPPRRVVDATLADRAYRALLARCPLSAKHRADLRARGLTDDQIVRHGYGTGPADAASRHAVAAAVAAELGHDLAGAVPGFIRDTAGRRTLVCGDADLLIPVRDVPGRVAGIRPRPDDPGEGGKYRWLSAGDDGPRSIGQDGHTLHVAQPVRRRTDHVLIVEGEIKANIAADAFGCIVLAVPGVGNTNQVLATLADLLATNVAIAYDKDTKPQTIENVAAAETRLAHLLIDAGHPVAQWTWGAEEAKGIDDLLAAGLWPFPIPHPALTQPRGGTAPATSAGHDDRAAAMNRAQTRIRRNTRLPARPMAAAVVGLIAQAATASDPAGGYRVPAGFALAPVSTLAFEAGTKTNNAGIHLKKLDEAGLISRHTIPDTLRPGSIDPETGESLATPRRITRHFIAVKGHEHEPITPAVWSELVDRMATYDTAAPERRGGRRIPRCPDHPHAPVGRHWTARCGECDRELDRGVDEIPAMLLVPIPTVAQTLGDRPDPDAHDDATPFVKTPPGIRPIAHKDRETVAPAAVEQSLLHRETHGTAPIWDALSEDERRTPRQNMLDTCLQPGVAVIMSWWPMPRGWIGRYQSQSPVARLRVPSRSKPPHREGCQWTPRSIGIFVPP
jgi:hypothetical protein